MTTTTETPVRPAPKRYALPAEDKVVHIVNGTFDDLREFEDGDARAARKAYSGPHPAVQFDAVLPGEGGLCEVNGGELSFYGIVAIAGEKELFVAMGYEFHYRNDASRHKWGTPVTLEEHLPLPDRVTPQAEKAFETAVKNDERAALYYREYAQPNGTSTDDRHVLILYFPVSSLTAARKTIERAVMAII